MSTVSVSLSHRLRADVPTSWEPGPTHWPGVSPRQVVELHVVVLDLGLDLTTPHGEFTAHVLAAAARWNAG